MRSLNCMKRVITRGVLATIGFLLPASVGKLSAHAGQLNYDASHVSARLQERSAAQKRIDGIWVGVLEVQSLKLRLVLKVARGADGALSAKLDSVDQAANDLPIDTITFEGQSVRFAAKNLGLSYEGTLSNDGAEISGQLKQGPASYPLTFKRTGEAPRLGRPQDPQKPYPYAEEEVAYENKRDGVRLAGTLTLPRAKGPFPAVLLITGSGPQDRNETILGHRPFLVLADYLTRRGIAVLRVDDRGVGGSSAGAPTATSENYAGDVLAGVEFLKNRKEINPLQIGLIGHSEGGMIAPMAAIRSKDIAFIVLIAGLGQRGDGVILLQTDLLLKASGTGDETIKQTHRIFERLFTILKKETDNTVAEKQIRETLNTETAAMTEGQRKAFAPILATINTQIPLYLSNWFRFFLKYDPHPTLTKVRIPVLAITGEKDLQAPPKENLSGIAAALKEGGNKDYTTVMLPQLNHLLQTSQTGLPSEYGEIEETISPVALQTISDWILKRTKGGTQVSGSK